MDTKNLPPLAAGPTIGLTAKERQRASLADLVHAAVVGDAGRLAFYNDVSESVRATTEQQVLGSVAYLIPADLLGLGRRDMTAAGVSGSNNLVSTDIAGFADTLARASLLVRLPVTRHPNLRGNQTLSFSATRHSTTWLANEATSASDAAPTFGQLTLSPKVVSASLSLSAQFMRQAGPAAKEFVDAGLARALAEAVDAAALNGTGTGGQPTGIFNTVGIDTRAGTAFSLADAAAMLKVAEGYDAGDGVAFVAGVDAAEDLRTRLRSTNGGETLLDDAGRLLGRPVLVTRNASAQQLAVLDWAKAHLAEWGALEIGIDPATHFKDGRVLVRALWRVDVAFEAPGQIAVATALT